MVDTTANADRTVIDELVEFLKSVNWVFWMLSYDGINTKIIDFQCEGDGIFFVAPQAISVLS